MDNNPCEDDAEIQNLVQQALVELLSDDEELDENGLPPSPRALWTLRLCGTRKVFEVAKSLCQSANPDERNLGVSVLGQLGISQERGALIHSFPEEKSAVLLSMLEHEQDVDVLASIAFALGHMHSEDERAITALVQLSDHPHKDVRFGVAFALGGYTDERSIQTLIKLSQDVDEDVRDWATFGLGTQLSDEIDVYIDSPEIREALYRNINDPHEDTRCEALIGLAYRRDKRIIQRLIDDFSEGVVDFGTDPGEIFCEMLSHLRDEITDPRLSDILKHCEEAKAEKDARYNRSDL